MARSSPTGFIERLAKSHMLLPIGYKEFPENPGSHDWRALIVGLSLVPIMLLAASLWFAYDDTPGAGAAFAAMAIVFFLIWILPKIILWNRTRN
ncbi:hypothetical protein IDM40_06835 [Nocardiopsis sp. HNM0947]|uniref:Uncharacterized protein n=1 Tax=Nocardiopsis coralli TaxID=2772213 RepID=A0ABR9P3N4_9ACTN|nr:hypothetical protein [Nocardiopsis coralli]MBE2998422.1 hypothetical protein [Nocardiopsis coralli]